jgi:hypothetical protein
VRAEVSLVLGVPPAAVDVLELRVLGSLQSVDSSLFIEYLLGKDVLIELNFACDDIPACSFNNPSSESIRASWLLLLLHELHD